MKKMLLLIVSAWLTTIALADIEEVDGITWTYWVSGGKATVRGGYNSVSTVPTSTTGAITIPSTLGGYPVTSIGRGAFWNCLNLTSVSIPEGVTSIGDQAFYHCLSLTSVTIPSSVTSIGSEPFYLSDNLREVTCLGAPPSGWKNAGVSSSAIVHYPLEYLVEWKAILSSSQAMGTAVEVISSADVSVEAEMTTPKTMKVTYTIHSEKCDKAKVYALAFENGERSFAKVVPVKTAATDSPEAVPNGREVTTNEPHTFIWNVPADWDTDLSKVMVEILVQEGKLLPMESVTIPANDNHAEMTISTNVLRKEELFNALLWCYASGDTALTNTNGVVKVNGTQIAKDDKVPTESHWTSSYDPSLGMWDSYDSSWETKATALLNYLYGKMGYKVLSGSDLTYAQKMTRLPLSSSGLKQVAIKVATASASEE